MISCCNISMQLIVKYEPTEYSPNVDGWLISVGCIKNVGASIDGVSLISGREKILRG